MDRLHWTPVGPLPAAVYWRRRAGVLLGVLVVVLLLLQLVGDDDHSARVVLAPAPSASPQPAPAASGSPSAACTPAQLRVQADTAPAEVPSGTGADVRVAVTNTSGEVCSVRLGAAAVELVVLSGSDRIWSSGDCPEPVPSGLSPEEADGRVDLAAGERRLVSVPWDGRRSGPGCPGDGAVALPGTYRVLARVGAVEVEGRAFRVV